MICSDTPLRSKMKMAQKEELQAKRGLFVRTGIKITETLALTSMVMVEQQQWRRQLMGAFPRKSNATKGNVCGSQDAIKGL